MNDEGRDDPARRVVDGRFELVARLGGGGMGMVWRATDLVLRRSVAVKEVRPADPGLAEWDPEAARLLRERVLREARALARVDHPNVVTIHHIVDGGPGTYPWIVMELVTGGSLADRLAAGPMNPVEAARIGREVLAALRAAHEAGIEHRDVKPANVLLRPDGRPVLTDFGIAAVRETTALTATGSVIGTPDFMAPERVSGKDGGPAADLWSLAMMLYVAVEGHHPLRRGTTLATLAAVLAEDVPPPVQAGPLTDVLTRVLVRDPAARPDAAALDGMLARAARQTESPTSFPLQPPSAPPQDTSPHGTSPQGASPWDARPQGVSPKATAPMSAGPAPRRRRTLLLLPAAAVAVAGVLAWTLLPRTGDHTSGSTDSGTARTTTSPSAGSGSTASPTAARQAATTDLLTPQGIRTAVAAFEKQTGRDRFGKLAVYPQYVIAWLMVKGSDTAYDMYTYRAGQGVQKDIISGTLPGDGTPVRLDGFAWDKVPALLAQARKQLKVPDADTRYLVVDLPGNAFGDPAGMSVYLSNKYSQSGYLQTDKAGKVVRVMPYDG
ncbi:serine/threonine-protein kinase [Streptomyces shenzhenensis]|uniref:serine/threonine-protein kinase n=1 Tax=Streptomyces shenzhenensis TaxID=943815 RepID=UPI0015F0EF29|nr:serine/threonine-protein kinase [Streptomyces shenzhenensis]